MKKTSTLLAVIRLARRKLCNWRSLQIPEPPVCLDSYDGPEPVRDPQMVARMTP